MKLFYTHTGNSISVLFRNSMQTITSSHMSFDALRSHLTDPSLDSHDEFLVAGLLDKREALSRLTEGSVTVLGETVYYNGTAVHSSLSDKLVELLDEGHDAAPWAKFMNNVMDNPTDRARNSLYDFITRFNTPLTPDGCFVAFKYVSKDFKSVHASPDGTHLDHSIGTSVTMPREQVDPDPNRTCSTGLHCCASQYLGGYSTSSTIIAVKVNPRDVVAVPIDYGYSKMRCCAYEVIIEMESDTHIKDVESRKVVDAKTEAIPPARDKPDVQKASQSYKDSLNAHPQLNGQKFHGYWRLDSDADVGEGSFVVTGDSNMVGVVTNMEFVSGDDLDGHYDKSGNWITNSIVTTQYEVLWQNGDTTTHIVTDGVTPSELLIVVFVKTHSGKKNTFYHEATGKTFKQGDLAREVHQIGQRAFSAKHGIPRTTLQRWLAKIK